MNKKLPITRVWRQAGRTFPFDNFFVYLSFVARLEFSYRKSRPNAKPKPLAEIRFQTLKIILTIVLFSFFLICCESKKKSEFTGIYEIKQSSDSILFSTATLKIENDNNYEYKGNDLEMNKSFFSNGTWKIKNDTLILTTNKIEDCYYIKETISMQCENFSNDDYPSIITKPYIESNLTIKNCKPKNSNIFYTNLNDEKFYFKNGKLIYLKRKNDCSKYFPEIEFNIEKQNQQ